MFKSEEPSENRIDNGDQLPYVGEVKEDDEEVVEESHFEESKELDSNYTDNFQEPQSKRAKLSYYQQEINGVP